MIKSITLAALMSSTILLMPAMATGKDDGPKGGTNTHTPIYNTNGQAQGQLQGQAQGQLQGQSQSSRNSNRNNNLNANVNANQNRNTVRSSNRNTNTSQSVSRATSRATATNSGNHQSTTYNEAKQRLQAPGIAASFSSVVGSPCEATPFGLGATGPGFGGLFQVPVQRGECWNERSADRLMAWGCSNAAIAVLAGNSVAVAMANNPCGTVRRTTVRAKY